MELNVLDPAFRPDSDEVVAARAESWYARTPIGFAILRHREATALLADRRVRWGGVDFLAAQGITSGPAVEWMGSVLPSIEGPAHTRLRRLVSKAFTPAAVDRLRPDMRSIAEELIAPLAQAGECEFMAEFADRYPARVICELLGVPTELRDQFRRLPNDIGLIFSVSVAAELDRIEAALATLHAIIDELLEQRRATPGPDLLTELLAAEEAGDRLSPAELRTMTSALLFAGQDTTRQQLGLAMRTFLDHQDQWRLLAADPALAPRAVAEVMRVAPSVNTIWRVAEETFDFAGLTIPAGSFLNILVNAAHTDPEVFGDNGFDITATRSAAQLAFGGGIHFCLGAPLARAELAEALPILARRVPEFSAAGPIVHGPNLGPVGPIELPLRFG
ncbi:cytochrome P450 [Nocardia concava]|uniref:cytochrome P450 n=1 Tax=Nocardia concava TaxID=257281 RepID=UPI0002DA0D83|nr:cytochrome P450 [Nocardia concava]